MLIIISILPIFSAHLAACNEAMSNENQANCQYIEVLNRYLNASEIPFTNTKLNNDSPAELHELITTFDATIYKCTQCINLCSMFFPLLNRNVEVVKSNIRDPNSNESLSFFIKHNNGHNTVLGFQNSRNLYIYAITVTKLVYIELYHFLRIPYYIYKETANLIEIKSAAETESYIKVDINLGLIKYVAEDNVKIAFSSKFIRE